jgi:uncharacterized protein (DUF1778 family)
MEFSLKTNRQERIQSLQKGSPEIRGRAKREHYELIKAVADFTGDTPFEFCLTAGLEKARELILDKIAFEKALSEHQSSRTKENHRC